MLSSIVRGCGLVLLSVAPKWSGGRSQMRVRIMLALLLLCLGSCAFAATNGSIKQSDSSSGILILSPFSFSILGNGTSVTFAITPSKIPQSNAAIPLLPLVGITSVNGPTECVSFDSLISFTATVGRDSKSLIVTLASPPAANTLYFCSTALLFRPE